MERHSMALETVKVCECRQTYTVQLTSSLTWPPQSVLTEAKTMPDFKVTITPKYLVPDTNCFVDMLPSIKSLVGTAHYILALPLVGEWGLSLLYPLLVWSCDLVFVIKLIMWPCIVTKLITWPCSCDRTGRAEQRVGSGGAWEREEKRNGWSVDWGQVSRRSLQVNFFVNVLNPWFHRLTRSALEFIGERFSVDDVCLRALTTQGSMLASLAFRAEITGKVWLVFYPG